MRHVLFVGERRSKTAKRMDVRWESGRLAAKQLFDALDIVWPEWPYSTEFVNFTDRGGKATIKALYSQGYVIVAMGGKAQAKLASWKVKHTGMVHPAARGKIRRKSRYRAEVRRTLTEASVL